ncbi:MAG: cobalt ECF transporter T component CbiQ [Burkholderiaceae bacterium]
MNPIDRALLEFRALDVVAARSSGPAQLDPRAKLLVTLVFIVVVVSFDRYQVASLLPLTVFPLAMAIWGAVPLQALARKIALAAPFALMVGLFNPWLDRAPMLDFGALQISAGWVSFASILLRFVLAMSAALILVATTGINAVAEALSRVGAPRAFTTQLVFLYRYAFVLGEEASHMLTAAQLRGRGRPAIRFGVWVNLIGQLLLRAFERAQRIHLAMLARGFDGEMKLARRFQWSRADTRFTLLCCGTLVLLRWIDLPQALGQFLLRIPG